MAISNKYKIERNYIGFGKSRSGQKIKDVRFVVSHETANNSADADDHQKYFGRNVVSASAHTFVDDKKILEIIPLSEKAWHVNYNKPKDNQLFGDDANDTAIGVELCRTGNFKEAYDKYAWYHAYLCHKFGLNPRNDIVAHSVLDPQRRSDPESWLKPNGVTWNQFINDIVEYYEAWDGEVKVIDRKEKVKTETVGDLIRKGDKGNHVKALQQDLVKAGEKLPRFGADGHFGDETEYAVKAFQTRHKLTVDGIVGPKTKSKLEQVLKEKSELTLPSGILRRGDRGEKVKQLQHALNKINFKCGAVDGIYGAKTEDAVRRFQSMYTVLKDDGIYGPNTRKYIEKKL